jgi:hypothetical protein
VSDTYSNVYTDSYAGSPVDPGDVSLVCTQIPGRPTVQVTATNIDTAPHRFEVRRSAAVAGRHEVRWLHRRLLNASASATAIDDEAPLGVPFTYTLYADGNPVTTSSEFQFDGPWTADGVPAWAWLRHLSLPSLSVPVAISALPTMTRTGRSGTFYPLGSGRPVVTSWPRGGREGELELVTLTDAGRQALLRLLDDGTPLQLATDSYFSVDESGLYMAVTDVVEERPVDTGIDQARWLRLTFIEVDAPVAAGAQGSISTYADLDAAYATYEALLTASVNNGWDYQDVLVGNVLP